MNSIHLGWSPFFENQLASDDRSRYAVGRILEEKGDYARAIPMLEDAVRQRISAHHSAADLAGTLYELANCNFYAGRYKESETLNQRVLTINREIYGDRHPRVAEVLVNLGAEPPVGFESYAKLIEIVSTSDAEREAARSRWRHYAKRGYPIARHEVVET